jgi:GNAT superfamily N-acetyltransferase
MIIRRFRPTDARRCYAIIKCCYLTVNYGEDSPTATRILIQEDTPSHLIENSRRRYYFVAVHNGGIVGVGGVGKDGCLHTFFVDPRHHGRGIGDKIMKRTLAEAKKRGFATLRCNSSLFAEGFYKKYGFKRIRRMNIPYKGDRIHYIKMERKRP